MPTESRMLSARPGHSWYTFDLVTGTTLRAIASVDDFIHSTNGVVGYSRLDHRPWITVFLTEDGSVTYVLNMNHVVGYGKAGPPAW